MTGSHVNRAAARSLHPWHALDPDTLDKGGLVDTLLDAYLDPSQRALVEWWEEVNPPRTLTEAERAELAEIEALIADHARWLGLGQ